LMSFLVAANIKDSTQPYHSPWCALCVHVYKVHGYFQALWCPNEHVSLCLIALCPCYNHKPALQSASESTFNPDWVRVNATVRDSNPPTCIRCPGTGWTQPGLRLPCERGYR
jgi:hypothetical protein